MPSLITVAEGIVLAVIEELRGKKSDITAKNVAATVAEKAEEAAAAAIQLELRKYEAMLGVVFAAHEVAAATQLVLQRMREAESGQMSTLLVGTDMQRMPDGWKPEDEPTKPDGGE